jgi:hypothetical protein
LSCCTPGIEGCGLDALHPRVLHLHEDIHGLRRVHVDADPGPHQIEALVPGVGIEVAIVVLVPNAHFTIDLERNLFVGGGDAGARQHRDDRPQNRFANHVRPFR